MVTNRTPVGRPTRSRITPAAITAFRRMEAARRLGCTCPAAEGAPNCANCAAWWEAHSELHDELGLKPWQWPAFEHPDETNPYPSFSNAARDWAARRAARPEAFELFRQLQEAADSQ